MASLLSFNITIIMILQSCQIIEHMYKVFFERLKKIQIFRLHHIKIFVHQIILYLKLTIESKQLLFKINTVKISKMYLETDYILPNYCLTFTISSDENEHLILN